VIPAIRVQTRDKPRLVHKNNTKIPHTERMRASRCASKWVPQQTCSRQSWVSRNHYRVTVSDADTWQHLRKQNHADTDQHDWHTALLVSVLLLTQRRINPGCHVARANNVRTVVPKRDFIWSSARNLLQVTLQRPRILRWLRDFWNICVPLTSSTVRCAVAGQITRNRDVGVQNFFWLLGKITAEMWKSLVLPGSSELTTGGWAAHTFITKQNGTNAIKTSRHHK
jgi:hypothetical protein